MKKYCVTALIALIFSVAGWGCVAYYQYKTVHYGFVNTERLLNSFSEAKKAVDEINVEMEKWNAQRTIIEDSLKAFEKRMEESYASLSVEKKKELKSEQISRIEELGRFNQAQKNFVEEKRLEKLNGVYQKINAAMNDFAKENGLDVVFASSNGSIVYGDGTKADLTEKFIQYLNARY